MTLDVLIRGGRVADGTGSPLFLGDVAIADGRIEEVGRLAPEATAARVIDATGKVVCPGFVDPHSHSDFSLLANPTAESTIRQGVTTEVVGNCGTSHAPVTDHSREVVSGWLHTFGYDGPVIPWTTFGEYLQFVSDVGHTPNLAWFVGHNTLRAAAGVSGSEPTEEQFLAMEGFVREALSAGALGMSTGLEFDPGREATLEELVRLNAVAGEAGGMYTSHVRNRDTGLLPAIEEFLAIARAGGGKAEISHLNVRHDTGAPDRGWERAVELMASAREEGLDVLADTTPFREGLGQLAGILPHWVSADGPEAALRHLADPDTRARLRGECDRYWRFIHKGQWERVRLQASEAHPELEGLTFAQIAEARGLDPWDCYFDVLLDAGTAFQSVLVVGTLFTDEHLAEMISHPLFSLGVDAFTVTLEGPLAEVMRHPLGYAGHVHYLTHHVRERGTLRLEEAIRKMTSMPAAHFGLQDRGLLRPGYAADVVVFDFDELEDVSTTDAPHAYARGVEHVLVNGVQVIDAGEHTGARPGRQLQRA
ncbi:MAG TPA: D-aminoacylase [Gaiella sp.]|uniref:N-acyl-D-amino-acid deacylase family protein n=1 Tax=Gaiella sp. TaxID=2663207 RepID=UPI002D80F991|nr:D-aminoacylase [Gaiella sp.]HET9289289.1 D-aminoacylase [Gaiella sp.]